MGSPIYPDDFYTQSNGFKVYLSWPVPNCALGCPLNWLNDGYCDKACNTTQCLWDGGDCLVGNNSVKISTEPPLSHSNPFNSQNYCSPNCVTNWLGDSFCDQVCNKSECAFDMADCGTNQFDMFYSIDLTLEQNVYYFPSNHSVIYFNLTNWMTFVYNGQQYSFQIKKVTCDSVANIALGPILNLRHGILIMTFNLSMPRQSLHFNINASILQKEFNFGFELNSEEKQTNFDTSTQFNLTRTIEQYLSPVTQSNLYDGIRIAKPLNISIGGELSCDIDIKSLPTEIQTKFMQIDQQHKKGILTNSGREGFYNQLKWLYKELICNATFHELDSPEKPLIEFMQSNFNQSTFTFKTRKLLDAYADSLVYVNHLYNKVFGVKVRKAPAHMAHYVDKDIIFRLQKRFPEQFEQTSSHKIRHSQDMQFSFSYFYYLMHEMFDPNIEQFIDSFDLDNSGYLHFFFK